MASNYDTTYTSKYANHRRRRAAGGVGDEHVPARASRRHRRRARRRRRLRHHTGHPLRERHRDRRHHRPRCEQRRGRRAEARRGKHGDRPRDRDGHLRPVHRVDHKLGRRPGLFGRPSAPRRASSKMALGFANGVPPSATNTTTTCSSSSKSEFVDGVRAGTVDTVPIVMLCDTGTAAREECDAGRAAVDAINNKFDGYLRRPAAPHEAGGDGQRIRRRQWARTTRREQRGRTDPAGSIPSRSVGPGGTTCTKSVSSNEPQLSEQRGCLPTNSWTVSTGGNSVASRHLRVVDGHEVVRPVPTTRTWCASRAPRTRSARGCWLSFKLLRLEAHRHRLRRRRRVGRGHREDPERKPRSRGRRTPRQQVRVVVLCAPCGGGHRGPRRGSASTKDWGIGLT